MFSSDGKHIKFVGGRHEQKMLMIDDNVLYLQKAMT